MVIILSHDVHESIVLPAWDRPETAGLRGGKYINTALQTFGLELRARRRTIQEFASYPRMATSGWILEIIGTQAVGKSTLNSALHHKFRSRWFFRDDLQYAGTFLARSEELERLHRRIFFKRIRHEEASGSDTWKSVRVSDQACVAIEQSLTITLNDFPRGFVLNEGLFKSFPREILELGHAESIPLWRNRAFVYMRAREPEVAVERYQERAARRRRRGLFLPPKSDAEVRRRVLEDNVLFDRLYETAQSNGCPVLLVHAEDSLASAVERVLGFEGALAPLPLGRPSDGLALSRAL